MTAISSRFSTTSPHRPAQQVVLPYLVVSLTYIFCSDLVVQQLTRDPELLTWLQTTKGWVFIGLTAVALYLMIYWQVQRVVEAERRTREQETQFAHLFDNAVSGMLVLDADGKILRINSVAAHMLGYEQAEVLGSSVVNFTHPDDRPVRIAYLQRQMEGEKPEAPLEVRYRHRNGEYVWMLVSSVLVRDVDGKPQCFISQVVNITDRRKAEQELQEHRVALAHASRLITLGELAAGLTHELTQPLTAIGQYAAVARRGVQEAVQPVSEPLYEAVEGVHEEAERAREIVERWRNFARGQSPRPTPIDANDVVRDAVRMLNREAQHEGVRLRIELQEGLPRVQADHVQIEQVLVNLMANAIDSLAARRDGAREILVRTARGNGRSVVLSVADNGPGIRPADRPRLFEPFFTTKPDGVGLGLPISRSIVQSHGGSIEVEDRDGWTAFRFELPIYQEPDHVAA